MVTEANGGDGTGTLSLPTARAWAPDADRRNYRG
jgi:hypothetical protein